MVSAFTLLFSFVLVQLIPCPASALAETPPDTYTRLEPISTLKIVASSEAYPGGRHEARNLIDGNLQTEYSSDNKGTSTFVEFDLGGPKSVVAFRHVERNDRATIGEAELNFLDENGQSIATYPVTHVNQRSAVTFFELPSPVTAQRVRWHVTRLGAGLRTVGGAEIVFFTVGKSDPAPTATKVEAKALDMLERKDGALAEPLNVTLDYPYLQPVDATVQVAGVAPVPVRLKPGSQTLQISLPETILPRKNVAATPSVFSSSPLHGDELLLPIKIAVAGQTVASSTALLKPVRHLEIFLLPHSHNDIGYTALQADVEQKQNSNIETGLRLAQATANYPEGARFKWNTEVLWCVDNYLRDATPEKRAAFIAAVKAGQIGLDALYGNTLTGLCRPEELLNLMGYAERLSQECGAPIESAMISDVPGYTWSTVSAMAQAGVKYFSFAPNYFDRMGGTMKEWQNRPFWWKGPDGHSRVLCWCPSRGYALGHLIGDGEALARFIPSYLVELETNSYPYDITHLRWNVHGDNGSPDEKLADVVRDWNARYAWPRLIISTTAAAFREFERRYGDKLPEFSGDYTPYWEDGAASSALETAMNRASAERLVQAETLWAMRQPAPFPAGAFQDTWRNILLYSEHTWGAHNSISQPDLPFVTNQWHVKQAFARDAEKESQDLLARALAVPPDESVPGQVDVFNTSSWARTDLVTLARELSAAGDRVVDERGKIVPSQRLSAGELAFLARDVPPYSAKRFRIEAGACPSNGSARAEGANLSSSGFRIRIDERTGAIASLTSRSLGKDLVDAKAATALNDYFYLPGSDLKDLQRNGVPHIRVKEKGPLVASVLIECEAPGCRSLSREVRLVDGLDWVELINTIDKLPIRAKEGLHFGFGFAVPDGEMRLDVGWAVVRPEVDQIPAACKNWFSVQRWVDISNDKFGVTWSPVDAPLVEDGAITANLVGSQTDWRAWIQHLKPSQTLYSWVMNNHWHTNYRADQQGPTVFRFVLRPHKGFSADEAARFGVGCSQPLLVARASGRHPTAPPLALSTDHVLVTAFKPSDDGKARIVRLFGASGKAQKVKLTWAKPAPRQVWLSDLGELPKTKMHGPVEVPAWGIVTLRAE
jgi:hypothetical protein